MVIARSAIPSVLIALALTAQVASAPALAAVAQGTSFRIVASNDNSDCEAVQRWFAAQPGSRLVLSTTSNFYVKSARTRKPDTVLDYSAFPLSHDQASWYKLMKHYPKSVGNGRCLSGFYDPVRKAALIYVQYGTASDLTVTTVSSAPTGLPIHSAPNQTRNGARLGMSVAQVQAIDGPGRLSSTGRFQRLTYSQDFKTPADVAVNAYLAFLFADGKLVAIDAGGGV